MRVPDLTAAVLLGCACRYSQDRVALDSSQPLYGEHAAAMSSEALVAADPLQQLWFQV